MEKGSEQFMGTIEKGQGHKSLLKNDALYQYILDTTVFPREPDSLKELRNITSNLSKNGMASSADEVQFLSMLVKLMNAKNTMEIGVFTGYSLLAIALALPQDGKGIKHKEMFDFVFVDADKCNYMSYHKRLMELVKVGGLIAYDNTLWSGAIVEPPETVFPDYIENNKQHILDFDEFVARDPRVEVCQLSISGGLTLCRRLD